MARMAEVWVDLVHVTVQVWDEFYLTFMTENFSIVEKVRSTLHVSRLSDYAEKPGSPRYLQLNMRDSTYCVEASVRVIQPMARHLEMSTRDDFLRMGWKAFPTASTWSKGWLEKDPDNNTAGTGDTIMLEDPTTDELELSPKNTKKLPFMLDLVLIVSAVGGLIFPGVGELRNYHNNFSVGNVQETNERLTTLLTKEEL